MQKSNEKYKCDKRGGIVGEILISHIIFHMIIGSYVFICSLMLCNNGGMSYGFAIREGGNLSFLYQEWSKAPENRPGQRSS